MKKLILMLLFSPLFAPGQSQEAKQLLLNVEKLAQLKLMLSHMKTGYQVLSTGYNSIADLSKGNFSLHKNFLDGLLQVSPAVRSYKRIADIIALQQRIVREYRSALAEFKSSRHFTTEEAAYMGKVYSNLFAESLKKLEELITVLSPGELRMTDDERLSAIDRIGASVEEQYMFLSQFNQSTALLARQRDNEQREIDLMRKLHGLR